jgi:hypothetical protein
MHFDEVTLFVLFKYVNLLEVEESNTLGYETVGGWAVPTVANDCDASIFRVRQYKKKFFLDYLFIVKHNVLSVDTTIVLI